MPQLEIFSWVVYTESWEIKNKDNAYVNYHLKKISYQRQQL